MRTYFFAKAAVIWMLIAASTILNAQDNKKEKLMERFKAAQARVDKAAAGQREADSLVATARRLEKEGYFEQEGLINEQAKLEKRVFDVALPEAEKLIASDNPKERKLGEEKKSAIRKAYNADLKDIQDRYSVAIKKLDESTKNNTRGKEKMKVANQEYKDALSALQAVEKEIAAIEGNEQSKEREAQKAQAEKEAEAAAKQKEKEEAEAEKLRAKEEAAAEKEAAKQKQLSAKEKEAAKRLAEKEKEDAKKAKEKEKMQQQRDKEAAKRQAEKDKQAAERAELAEERAKEKEKRDAEKAAAAEKREADKVERERIAAEKAKEREAKAAALAAKQKKS
jgi:hypothetical protein